MDSHVIYADERDGEAIAESFLPNTDDARLIAAAPELLEAAKHAISVLRANPGSPMTASEALLDRAIYKATGVTP